MRLIYSALFILLLPLIVLRLLWRSRRAPAYRRRLAERLGFFDAPPADRPLLWVHAVSLGETLAARPLIERLLDALPEYRVAITTTTPTGSEQVRRLFGTHMGEAAGHRVFHVYAPWDTPGAVRRALDRLQPRLLLIMETELWPNLLHGCHVRDCPVVLANARLSERSAAGYGRFPGTTRRMLAQLTLVAAQSEETAQRFRALGAAAERVVVSGSVKFDLEIDAATRARALEMRTAWGLAERPVLIAASTHDGEEALILEAFAALRATHPTLFLLLVPRHPERFDTVDALCRRAGWTVQRRSRFAAQEAPAGARADSADLLLVDTIGELLLFYGLADVAVVGGSFDQDGSRGGHNPLEPAAWGSPVLCGPSMFNFEEITTQLREAGALQQLAGAAALQACLGALLEDATERRRRGAAGRMIVESNRGAVERVCAAVEEILARGRNAPTE